ncbi:NAD(+) kinase [Coxiella endosymbiont of Ornithodoros amblus]|uniref:NAD(+) kinase n=1 Tax=Coxiella endosymbiont of Ornithodoros amblus TaxID=1656166 RepID=UPI00244E41CF|nr:NAD(+) kinase [Coxiella endosymbiont of Ornithodoros amblus]MBW5803109.1 NAD(+) kinase [Coxiella endosymbiont of Ornithodoros amblus]
MLKIVSKLSFSRIALMGREGVEEVPETLVALKDYLVSLNREVILEENAAHIINGGRLLTVPASDLKKKADLLIVVGGDGSLLNAAHIAVPQQLPVLGINRGRFGFLTDIPPNDLTQISNILDGHYREEVRFLLEATVEEGNEIVAKGIALNDIVLLSGNAPKMIEFDIFINDEFVCNQRADGLIITTPTGSTAYALSGGGPILHPQLNAMALVPMFPHTLSSRPIVVDAESQIKITISPENDVFPYVSNDGQERVSIKPGGKVYTRQYLYPLHLIHPTDYNYYETLRRKLDWEKRTAKV